jgi:hypothetical protein
MRAFEFLTEYRGKGVRDIKYRDGGKPDWYEKAVQLKTDNPRMSASEIGRQVGVEWNTIQFWLTGKPDYHGRIYTDNPPFTQKDFPMIGNQKYFDGAKPDWYEKAVQLKTDNPRMTAKEIGRQVGASRTTVQNWLTGKPESGGRIYNDNPPFTQKDFPYGQGSLKYFDGEKPEWYEEAIKLRKQGMMWKDIANKLSTPEKRIMSQSVTNWLVKGRKYSSGKIINPDAPFTPKPRRKPINTDLIKELIVDKYTDEEIIELIADEKGDKIASQVRTIIPQLRRELQPGTEVRNKVTGDDISGFVQENFSD